MVREARGILLAMILVTPSGLLAGDDSFAGLEGRYLGQEPPGLTPRLFAPGIVVDEGHEGSSGFALGGTVYLFQRFLDRRCLTYVTYLRDGHWTAPELIPFWETMIHNGDFVFSSDDRTMLYQVKTERNGRLDSDIWRVEVGADGWGPGTPLPAPVNTVWDESFAAEALNGNLYFFSRRPAGVGQSDLYMSSPAKGGYSEPLNLRSLNTEHEEWDPFVAPDESYLIFCSTRPGGLGRDDLYVTFRNDSGGWATAVNMGEAVNSPGSENRPYVTVDGKYLFFTSTRRGNRDIYWVGTALLDPFRPSRAANTSVRKPAGSAQGAREKE